MEPVIVGLFLKNRTEAVGGEINEFEGRLYAHVRVFKPGLDGNLHHTRKGVAVPLEDVGQLREVIHRLKDVSGSNRLVGKIDLGRDQIRVGTRLYEGHMYVDVRRFYYDGARWQPTSKGVMLRPELLDQLIDLVDRLAEESERILSSGSDEPTA